MTIDRMGRRLLRGKWKSAVTAQALWAIGTGCLYLEGMLTARFGQAVGWVAGVALLALDLAVLSPLKYGIAAWYWRIGYKPHTTLRGCLRQSFGRDYGRAVSWRWQYWLHSVKTALVCLLPAAMMLGFDARFAAIAPADTVIYYRVLTWLLVLIGWIAHRIVMLTYLPAVYLIVSGMDVSQAFVWSKTLMRGERNRTLCFLLGFGPWALLYLLILPWLVVSPIWESAKAGWTYRLMKRHFPRYMHQKDGALP